MIDAYLARLEDKLNGLLIRNTEELVEQNCKIELDNRYYRDVSQAAQSLSYMRGDVEFLDDRLRQMGYTAKKRSGASEQDLPPIDYPRFQRDACITQSVWSRYYSGVQVRTSQDTLLKLVIGMRLNESEARQFLALAGSGFARTDIRDMIVLAVIMNHYYDLEEPEDVTAMVYDLLAFYSEQQISRGKPGLKNLYDF